MYSGKKVRNENCASPDFKLFAGDDLHPIESKRLMNHQKKV